MIGDSNMTLKSDLEEKVKDIFLDAWKKREGRGVPDPEDLQLGNDAVKLQATVLYADMCDSTDLVDKQSAAFAAEIYKAYLHCAAQIIKQESGAITAYDGDRIMAVFLGDEKNNAAVCAAMEISYTVEKIINPAMKEVYKSKDYQLKHVIGVDTSELFVARIGVRNDNDLVWVGRAANYAAKLCSFNGSSSLYITEDVFDELGDTHIYGGSDHTLMWTKQKWEERNNKIIYGSNWRRNFN
jgi:class 3 adenylate cyclase